MRNWDPKPDERRYYRHRATGDRAYLVRRAGADKMRLDRPQEILRDPGPDWLEDAELARFTLQQVAAVSFAADRQLLRAIGHHQQAKKEWGLLPEATRIDWVKHGPAADTFSEDLELRLRLWLAVGVVLGPLAK